MITTKYINLVMVRKQKPEEIKVLPNSRHRQQGRVGLDVLLNATLPLHHYTELNSLSSITGCIKAKVFVVRKKKHNKDLDAMILIAWKMQNPFRVPGSNPCPQVQGLCCFTGELVHHCLIPLKSSFQTSPQGKSSLSRFLKK